MRVREPGEEAFHRIGRGVGVTAAAFADLLGDLPDGGEVPLVVSGGSMAPFYRHRETVVTLRRERGYEARRGDAVFFVRTDGTPVLHRVIRVCGDRVTVGGDGQRWVETVTPPQILARVVRVRRRARGREVSVDAWGYRQLVRLWSCGRWWHPRAVGYGRVRTRKEAEPCRHT